LQGEQLVVSNRELTNTRVQNFKHLEKRRVVMTLGVVYGTSRELLERIPRWIKDIVEQQELTAFDRCHFSVFGPSSLDFEVVYVVESDDYKRYMEIRQAINLAIFAKFEQEGVDFAYPTQTIHLGQQSPG
jgi:small-conductance mechanosensitive channel